MSFKKVTAIFDQDKLDKVESALNAHALKSFTVHTVAGKGNYQDLYNNTLSEHIQMDIYIHQARAIEVANIIIEAAHSGCEDEGMVSISDVDKLFWIHSKQQLKGDELK